MDSHKISKTKRTYLLNQEQITGKELKYDFKNKINSKMSIKTKVQLEEEEAKVRSYDKKKLIA